MTAKSLKIEESPQFIEFVTNHYDCYFLIEKTGEFGPAEVQFINKIMDESLWGVRSKYNFVCIKDSKICTSFHKYQDDDRIMLMNPTDEIAELFLLEDASWYLS